MVAALLILFSVHYHFDVKLYESYVVRHHRPSITYQNSKFATTWTKNQKQCGGAMAEITLNPRTLSLIQIFQGCTLIETIDGKMQLLKEPWIS